MQHTPSVRSVREAILDTQRQTMRDEVALDAMRTKAHACILGIRRAIDRASDFANRGLVSEAAALCDDFPDLARQADALLNLPSSDPLISWVWKEEIVSGVASLPLPTRDEVDTIASYSVRAEAIRPLLDALRDSALRSEPISARLRLLRQLRLADSRNRLWLDQIESLEQDWLKRIAQLRHTENVDREQFDEALAALEANEWIAAVPRGLKAELYAKVKPLRAEEGIARYAQLATEIHDASSRMDQEEVLRLEAAWALVHQETGRMPDPSLSAAVSPAFDWLLELEATARAQASVDAQVELLELMLLERRAVADIGRQIATLRDFALPIPDGILDRACSYIASEERRAHRRHRLFLVGAVLTAIVLAVAAFMAIRAQSESSRRANELIALRGFLAEKDAVSAHAVTEAIQASGDAQGAQMTAAIAEANALFAAWSARIVVIERVLADAIVELERGTTRARVLVLQKELADARVGASEPLLNRLNAAELLRISALVKHDEIAEKATNAALAAVDSILDDWKLPDQWTDAEQLSPVRWASYGSELDRVLATLRAASIALAGFDAGTARVNLRSEGIASRRTEAKSRQDALQAALADLDPAQLCQNVSVEEVFVKRLKEVLAEHGAVLIRQRRMADFEAAIELAPAWLAIQAWRDEYQPRLSAILGPELANTDVVAAQSQAVGVIHEFRGKFPISVYGERLDEMATKLDPNSVSTRWLPERIALELVDARLANLDVVPLVGGRCFYRRPASDAGRSPAQMNPRNRAVKNLADVDTDPERLSSILGIVETDMTGRPRPSTISRAWRDAQGAIEHAQMHETQSLLVELLASIRNASDEEPLFQLRALRTASSILLQCGHTSPQLAQELAAWNEKLKTTARDATIADWPRAGYSDPADFKEAVWQAKGVIAQFPDLKRALAAAREAIAEAADTLAALAPIGVLAPVTTAGGTREIVGSKVSGVVVLVVNRGGQFELVEVTAAGGKFDAVNLGLSRGPMIVFRKIKKQ